jgi:4-hydroxy 2-oxovalerate aldolase
MRQIKVLDCTLRDGGYCNSFRFGFENEKKIIRELVEADIDIIECGFLTNKIVYEEGVSQFTSLEEVEEVLPEKHKGKIFVLLMNFGDYDPDSLPTYDGKSIDGLRVAFHKKDRFEALKVCRKIKEKGYKVFVQPMVSVSYKDEEFLELISSVNQIEPYAFYIVDSFGMMKRKDLMRLFYLIEHNLKLSIAIGFHSHNNMQLAYSNAQSLVDMNTEFRIIIDTTIYGMGRGAGNLNTELFIQYLNENMDRKYDIKPLLRVIDEILDTFYQRNYWGYSLPNFISATYNTHPNYAGYLSNKNALTVENIEEIFAMMSDEKRLEFDKEYIEALYLRYMEKGNTNQTHYEELKKKLDGKRVLIIAPGKSIKDEHEAVESAISASDTISIAINAKYTAYETDYIFVSNIRRFKNIPKEEYAKCIITSNISSDGGYIQTEYRSLLNNVELVRDNAGLMLINFLKQIGVKEVLLAGMDGYSHDADENYAESQMMLVSQAAVLDAMNAGMTEVLESFSKDMKITFITTRRYVGDGI